LLAIGGAGGVTVSILRLITPGDIPVTPPHLSPLAVVRDLRPVPVSLTTPSWTKVHWTVTVDAIRTDHRLWRQMHFNDWDAVPDPWRELGLTAMVRAYGHILNEPSVWREMAAAEWDRVPQPIRAMAYLRMVWYWSEAENVGAEFGYRPTVVAQTIAAIVMAESWFDHRALNQNVWGNRDLGLAQCSDHCRATIALMATQGEILFSPTEEEYFDPWIATRVATVWFERELHRVAGDIDLAIRAYHRGIVDAFDEKGSAYHARVVGLRDRYIHTQRKSDSWRFVARAVAPL
jgi:hypothetical protein